MRLEIEINLQFLKQLDHYLIPQISCIIYLAKSKTNEKVKKMREDDEIKNLLATKFDREVLLQLLGLIE